MSGSPKCQAQKDAPGCTTRFALQNLEYKNQASTCDVTINLGEIVCTIKGLESGPRNPVDYVLTLSVGGQHSQEIEFAEVMTNAAFCRSKIKKENDMINPSKSSPPKVVNFKVQYTGTSPDNSITIECVFRHGKDVRLDECKGCTHKATIIINVK